MGPKNIFRVNKENRQRGTREESIEYRAIDIPETWQKKTIAF